MNLRGDDYGGWRGRLIAGFQLIFPDAEADNEYTFDIRPTDAYGERDASLVETISQNVLLRSVGDPNVLAIGAPVEIGGRNGLADATCRSCSCHSPSC